MQQSHLSQSKWSPESWKTKAARQQPVYSDAKKLNAVLKELTRLPPLVSSFEIESLKHQLAGAVRGERFLLQGGDCSETFYDCESTQIAAKLKILLQMSLVLVQGCGKPLIRVGRIAGQYAKPRSSDTETRKGVTLPVFRGDIVNRPGFTAEDRTPDPALMLRGYERSALTINFIHALIDGGFADLHHPEYWDVPFVQNTPLAKEYTRMVESIRDSLRLMEMISGNAVEDMNRVDFYTSHEGLLLPYEQAQTRQLPRRTGWYDLCTHFPWIGNRTRALDGAHVEFFRGLQNPIALKIGSPITPEEVVKLCDILNPANEPGRLTLIHRFGAKDITTEFPPIIDAVQRAGKQVLWCCDPMHKNTEVTRSGVKTRRFEKILEELEKAYFILREHGAHLGGVHFELTGENVTECLGGVSGVTEADLGKAYKSAVDPRLNAQQALEMAFLLARLMSQERNGPTPK